MRRRQVSLGEVSSLQSKIKKIHSWYQKIDDTVDILQFYTNECEFMH